MARGSIPPIRRFSGVDLSKHPRDLEDDQLAWALNVYEQSPGRIATRPQTAYMTYGAAFTNMALLVEVRPGSVSLFSFNDRYGKHWLLFCYDRYLDGTNYETKIGWLDPVTGPTILTGFTSLARGRPQFLQWDNKAVFFAGNNFPWVVFDPKEDGTFATSFNDMAANGDTPVVPIFGNIAEVYRKTIAVAGMVGDESTIAWIQMDPADGTSFYLITPTKYSWVNKGDGDRIVGMKTMPVVGGADFVEPYMMVFKQRSTWLLSGDPPTSTTDGGPPRLAPLLPKVGCVAKETIVVTDRGIVWCSGDSVWLAPHAGAPVDIGARIRPVLAAAAKNAIDSWHAVFIDGIYKLTIPGVSIADGTSTSGNGITGSQTWWLDLREMGGAEPRFAWWGPMDYPAAASHAEVLPDGTVREIHALFIQASPFGFLFFAVGNQQTVGHLDADVASETLHITRQEIRFKEFDFGDPMLNKIIQAVEIECSGDTYHVAVLTLQGLGNEGSVVADFYTTRSPDAEGFVLDSGALDSATSGVLSTPMRTYAFTPPNSGRFVAKTFQPVLKFISRGETTAKLIFTALGLRFAPINRRPTP